MNDKKVVEIKNLVKRYGARDFQTTVLKGIDLTIYRGDFIAIMGPSGSGKTTLMNIIGCMDLLDSGEYYLNGRAIHETKESELTQVRNQEIGFIFQNYQLIPTYNVMQNIIMPLLIRGMGHREAKKKCGEIVKLLGIAHRLDHKPNELSGGQKQRVSIARALASEPAILLADEPTGALDSASGQEVLKLFDNLNRLGNTIVMITHDLKVANAAQRIVRIEDGCLKNGC